MRSYVEKHVFNDLAQAIWADAVSLVDRVSDRHGSEVRCHELARAALHGLNALNRDKLRAAGAWLVLVDGRLGAIEHSWLMYAELHRLDRAAPKRFILDVYCPGRLPQVQLIDGDHFVIARGYEAGEARIDVNEALVDLLVQEMQRGY